MDELLLLYLFILDMIEKEKFFYGCVMRERRMRYQLRGGEKKQFFFILPVNNIEMYKLLEDFE